MDITIYLLPIIVVLGIATSCTDIEFKTIRNRHLLLALGFTGLVYIYLVLTSRLVIDFMLIGNACLAASLGFILYLLRVWGAGDGKLFFVYSLLIPAGKLSLIFVFSCLELFINIFIVSLVSLALFSLPQAVKNYRLIFKNLFALAVLKNALLRILIVFAFGWILFSAIGKLNLPLPLFFTFMLIFILYRLAGNLIVKAKKTIPRRFQLPAFFILIISGLILKKMIIPETFSLRVMLNYSKYILFFTFLAHILGTVISLKKDTGSKRIAFAPFMFAGAILANTEFLSIIIRFFVLLKK